MLEKILKKIREKKQPLTTCWLSQRISTHFFAAAAGSLLNNFFRSESSKENNFGCSMFC